VLGKPEAQEPLREARELFASMGYEPALTETEALLRKARPPPCRSPGQGQATEGGPAITGPRHVGALPR
jgi:hypothetical protein